MDRIKFYSENDLSCGKHIDKIIERIKKNIIEDDWTITNLIEFYNILKYIGVKRFADYIAQHTGIEIKAYERMIRQKIGRFIGNNKNNFIDFYDEIDFIDMENFLEIIENFSIYKEFTNEDFKALLDKDYVHVNLVLKFKIFTEYFDSVIKEKILSDSRNAETVISKYLGESRLYLPPSFSEEETLNLIDEYIDSPQVNINVLRKIIAFPTGKGINIPDRIKLHAKRKEKIEEDKIFRSGMGIESIVSISYPESQEEAIQLNMDGRNVDIKVSRKWLEENLDYPTLWNNFIHLFGFVDDKFRLSFSSKKNDRSAFETVISPIGNHLYNISFVFIYREIIANAEISTYTKILSDLGVRLEDMIEWFFHEYIKKEFSIENFIVRMPSEGASYFEKCRTILPEIDRIFKQYNVLIEDGEIDQELIQMSSSSVKNKDIMSFNDKKYAYPKNGWYQTNSYLLFSDQSSIFYVPNKSEKHKNFFELIIKDNVSKNDFNVYQLQEMKWLFDNNLIYENEDNIIKFTDINLVYVLKELYYEDVLSYWHYPDEVKEVINNMESLNIVSFENTLLSRNEQDYLDYYLNKSKFTNGYDLRNRYLHGTNSNNEKQYETDYYLILKLIVITIIKINDDLCIKEDNAHIV